MDGGYGERPRGSAARSAGRSAILVGIGVSTIAGIALGGCGDDGVPRPTLEIGMGVDWNWKATSADEVGFVYTMVVEQKKNSDGSCDDLPASLQLFAFDQLVPLERDANNCVCANLVATPTMTPSSVTVTAERDGEVLAKGTFDNLIPGLGATLVAPADGLVHAGDEIVVAATPLLPSSTPGIGWVFPLEGTPWPGSEYVAGIPTRFPDGVHAKMPAFSGRAAVVLDGRPSAPQVTVDCQGFAVCVGDASNVLGPVFVTEAM